MTRRPPTSPLFPYPPLSRPPPPGPQGAPPRRAARPARPRRHAADRGAVPRAQAPLHHRHRHAQPAAGRPRLGLHRVLLRRRSGRGRAHRAAVHETGAGADGSLHYREVRMTAAVELVPQEAARTPRLLHHPTQTTPVIDVRRYAFWYGATQALFDLTCTIPRRAVTALIGPSGCGKSTFLRSINRLNKLIPGTPHPGEILSTGVSEFSRGMDAVALRR